MVKKFFKYYFPALVWAGIIFYFSSVPGLHYTVSTTKETILRKGAHFVEYAILSFLLWRIFYQAHKFSVQRSFWFSLVLSVFYASSDEFHQSLVFGRTGKTLDIVFDSISALFALEFIMTWTAKKLKWKNGLILLFSALTLLSLEVLMIRNDLEERSKIIFSQVSQNKNNNNNNIEKEETREIDDSEKEVDIIPESFQNKAPFTPQAPFAVWDEHHDEACEEASLIMLKYHLEGEKLTPQIAEKEIQEMIAFEIEKYGDYKDTNAEETVRLAKEFYKINSLKVVYNFSKDDIKKYLSMGRIIIVPAAGQLLGNPYFTPPGPLYHMLVLIGYDGDTVITNDPGTKRGEKYKYNLDILYEAIHDFTGDKEDIESGQKAMIVME